VKTLNKLLDEVVKWGTAIRGVRIGAEEENSEGLAAHSQEEQRPQIH
jgi:hypothetical protein